MLRLLLAPLLLACLLPAATKAVAAPPPLPLAFVHLSDIHYSTNVRKYWRLFGDREGDAALWAQQVVPRLRPAAALVTGDITDSKVGKADANGGAFSASLMARSMQSNAGNHEAMRFVTRPACFACSLTPPSHPSNPPQTARGEGLQQEVEWLAYASLLRNLSAAGVPEQLVWDVPGTLSVLLLLGLGHSTHADPGCTRSTTCS